MKKYLLSFCIAGLLCIGTPVQAQAVEFEVAGNDCTMVFETDNVVPYAEWIITNYSLGCSKADKAVKIIGKTSASAEMSKIGFKDIIIQKSSDNINWEKEVDVGDKITTSASTYSLANYSVSVEGGHFYRVKCTHYAKEKGLFGGSQSVENYSNSVWVD